MNICKRPVYQKGQKKKRKHKTVAEMAHPASKYGTDAEFLDWLTYQPSCLDGSFNQYQGGVGRNIACHVRRVAAGSGTAFKPPYSAVPMTDAQHKVQSGKEGEAGALRRFSVPHGIHSVDAATAKAWFEQQAAEHLQRWILEKENGFI